MDAATLPLSLDPLIAEAKQRMRRRRAGLIAMLLLAGAAALAFALWPSGGPPGGRTARGTTATTRPLTSLKVPLDSTERQWRANVLSLGGPATPRSTALRLRDRVLRVVDKTGAVPIRIKIWRKTSPAAVELVVATRVNPAIYLRHRAKRLVALAKWPVYVKVVDSRGKSFLEWGGAANTGFVGVPLALQSCSPVIAWGWGKRPPCPVK